MGRRQSKDWSCSTTCAAYEYVYRRVAVVSVPALIPAQIYASSFFDVRSPCDFFFCLLSGCGRPLLPRWHQGSQVGCLWWGQGSWWASGGSCGELISFL